jgi:hypothetical protein
MQRRSCGFGFLIGYMHPSLYYGKEKQMMLRVDMAKSVPVGTRIEDVCVHVGGIESPIR